MTSVINREKLRELLQNHHKPDEGSFAYGTAGFRTKAYRLKSVAVRVGIVAVLRSLSFGPTGPRKLPQSKGKESKKRRSRKPFRVCPATGVMITASHNPACDNGMKIVDCDGGMLDMDWEPLCEWLANSDPDAVLALLDVAAGAARSQEYVVVAMAGWLSQQLPKRSKLVMCANQTQRSKFIGKSRARARTTPVVCIGRDARSSSFPLSEVVEQTVIAMGGKVQKVPLCSTPQLHWLVGWYNKADAVDVDAGLPVKGDDTVKEAFARLAVINPEEPLTAEPYTACVHASFTKLLELIATQGPRKHGSKDPKKTLMRVDGAFGVGLLPFTQFQEAHKDLVLRFQVANNMADVVAVEREDSSTYLDQEKKLDEKLNVKCGAEHVQKGRALPVGFIMDMRSSATSDNSSDEAKGKKNQPLSASLQLEQGEHAEGEESEAPVPRRTGRGRVRGRAPAPSVEVRNLSVDGDGDRVVFFYGDARHAKHKGFHLLDGDRLLVLYSVYIRDLLKRSGMADKFSFGVVQTAYANGAATEYLKGTLEVEVKTAKTGVKHLHHLAKQFDVGAYFEANGHGTLVFSQRFREAVQEAASKEKASYAEKSLMRILSVINSFVGDAFCDTLLAECALRHQDWSLAQWHGLYEDYASAISKVRWVDRSIVRTTNAERTCVSPDGLQEAIDKLVLAYVAESEFDSARAFVRPSGTEDVVRVYAEAASYEDAEKLRDQVGKAVAKFCR